MPKRSRTIVRLSLAAALGLSLALPARALDGVAGPYLAGRIASAGYDYRAAVQYYTQALISDPRNPGFLESAIVANIALGEFERTIPMVTQIEQLGVESQAGNMVTFARLARDANWDALIAGIDKGRSAGQLVDGLCRAWALVGQGKMSDALLAFDEVAKGEGLKAFALYHKALALASVGDFEGADAIFSGEAGGPLRATRRGIIAHVQVLSQLERSADAMSLVQAAFGADPDPALAALRTELAAGKAVPFDVIADARDGVSEVFFTVAGALAPENPDVYTLAYARLAQFIRPTHVDAILLASSILETQGQYDVATSAYDLIPRDDPAFHAAEMGRADALVRADRVDAAVEVLQQLAESHPGLATVWTALGDTLRRQERYADAAAAYDSAIATFGAPEAGQWVVYFARGIAHEREKQWPDAEADFRTALELSPDQPAVLNYLGYSYVEMKSNLDEALAMIERAVAARPEDGPIIDSLGWALYRLGRYKEAVGHMEKAVELMPVDSIVNDHLGDVYWAVGREREAEFQWKRALSFEPETEEEAARIRRKLEVGLDLVLQAEGAEPLAVSENAD